MHDFDHIARRQQGGIVLRPGHDFAVSFDRDRAFRQPKLVHQALDGQAVRHTVFLSVDCEFHELRLVDNRNASI